MMVTQSTQLVKSLQASDISNAWEPEHGTHALLWILFVGYCGTWGAMEKGWLMLEFRRVVHVLGLKSVEEAVEILSGLIFRECAYGKALRQLWNDTIG